MIKRHYFISTELNSGRESTHSYRTLSVRSIFPDHVRAIDAVLDKISSELGCKPSDLIVKSFSRC
jgi:hypothetical protein